MVMSEAQTIEMEDVRHSHLGASGSWRWMNCAGSVNLIAKLPEELANRTNMAAAEGTAAHLVLAICAEEKKDAWEMMGVNVVVGTMNFTVDQEMADGVQLALDWISKKMELFAGQGARLYIEKSLESFLDKDAYGQADIVIYVPGDRILINDFKYGQGVVVEPDSNQNKYYGAICVEEFDFTDEMVVELYITQPRIPHPKGLIRLHVTNADELTRWFAKTVIPAMKETRNKNAMLTIGSWCKFCPARECCPALKKEVFEFSMDIEPDYLTNDELGAVLRKKDAIIGYFSKLEWEAFKRARAGSEVPGCKLVRKTSVRVWKDKAREALIKQYGKDAYAPSVLLTAPAAEKALKDRGGKKFVKQWAYKPDAGLTIAAVSDKREAVHLTGEEHFGDTDVGEEQVDI